MQIRLHDACLLGGPGTYFLITVLDQWHMGILYSFFEVDHRLLQSNRSSPVPVTFGIGRFTLRTLHLFDVINQVVQV